MQRFSSNSRKLLLVTYCSQNRKIKKNFIVLKFGQFFKALTVKSSIFKNKRTSHPEISKKVYRTTTERYQMKNYLKIFHRL